MSANARASISNLSGPVDKSPSGTSICKIGLADEPPPLREYPPGLSQDSDQVDGKERARSKITCKLDESEPVCSTSNSTLDVIPGAINTVSGCEDGRVR